MMLACYVSSIFVVVVISFFHQAARFRLVSSHLFRFWPPCIGLVTTLQTSSTWRKQRSVQDLHFECTPKNHVGIWWFRILKIINLTSKVTFSTEGEQSLEIFQTLVLNGWQHFFGSILKSLLVWGWILSEQPNALTSCSWRTSPRLFGVWPHQVACSFFSVILWTLSCLFASLQAGGLSPQNKANVCCCYFRLHNCIELWLVRVLHLNWKHSINYVGVWVWHATDKCHNSQVQQHVALQWN